MTLQAKLCAVCLDHTFVLCSDKMRVNLLSESWLDGKIWLCHEFLFVVHFHMKKQLNIWCWAFFIIFDPSQLCSSVYGQLWPAVLWSIPFESRNIMLNAGVWEKMWNQNRSFSSLPELTPTPLTCLIFFIFMSSKPSHILLFCCWFIATRLQM